MEDLTDQETKYPSDLLSQSNRAKHHTEILTLCKLIIRSGLYNSRNIKHISYPNLTHYKIPRKYTRSEKNTNLLKHKQSMVRSRNGGLKNVTFLDQQCPKFEP